MLKNCLFKKLEGKTVGAWNDIVGGELIRQKELCKQSHNSWFLFVCLYDVFDKACKSGIKTHLCHHSLQILCFTNINMWITRSACKFILRWHLTSSAIRNEQQKDIKCTVEQVQNQKTIRRLCLNRGLCIYIFQLNGLFSSSEYHKILTIQLNQVQGPNNWVYLSAVGLT